MASKYTKNYSLCQWEATDQVLRTDFNEDNKKVDTALNGLSTQMKTKADQTALNAVAATIPKIAVGTYTGDGNQKRTIPLPFTPKAVFVNSYFGATYDYGSGLHYFGGLAVKGGPLKWYSETDSISFLEIVSGGFTVASQTAYSHSSCTNQLNMVYYYLAIG